jgi:hypothetical protein
LVHVIEGVTNGVPDLVLVWVGVLVPVCDLVLENVYVGVEVWEFVLVVVGEGVLQTVGLHVKKGLPQTLP